VFVARNGVFMEKEFLSKGVSRSKVQLEEIQEIPENVSTPTDPI
jgi:ribosomal protein L20A (L18A)